MDHRLLLKQRADLEGQLKEELKACRATRRKIAAVDMLLGHTAAASDSIEIEPNERSSIAAFAPTLEKILEKDHLQKSIMQTVREALESADGPFTAQTLVEAVNGNTSCSLTERDVSHPLWKLNQQGVIRIIAKGSGKRPNVYIKLYE